MYVCVERSRNRLRGEAEVNGRLNYSTLVLEYWRKEEKRGGTVSARRREMRSELTNPIQ